MRSGESRPVVPCCKPVCSLQRPSISPDEPETKPFDQLSKLRTIHMGNRPALTIVCWSGAPLSACSPLRSVCASLPLKILSASYEPILRCYSQMRIGTRAFRHCADDYGITSGRRFRQAIKEAVLARLVGESSDGD